MGLNRDTTTFPTPFSRACDQSIFSSPSPPLQNPSHPPPSPPYHHPPLPPTTTRRPFQLMEENIIENCSIIYFCSSAQDDIHHVYHQNDTPTAPADNDLIRRNVRALLDEDQGDFDEGARQHLPFPPLSLLY